MTYRVMRGRHGSAVTHELARTRRYNGALHRLDEFVLSERDHHEHHGARVAVGPVANRTGVAVMHEGELLFVDEYWVERVSP